jgi:DNA polymerase III subunit gamma/tau
MNNTEVLALKYRPKCLSDIVGQETVVTTLTNAFNAGSLPQTMLFCGQFGGGKTTLARILAAMENCETGRTLTPCGKCKNCEDIFLGRSFDIKEINAAQNRGIDDIRNLSEFVSVRPLNARVKYILMDEAHQLSREAAESALKMLEEPPDGVRYILATTDVHKLKGTIQSRCMPFRFNKISWPTLAAHIKDIAGKENISINDDAIRIIAKISDGSVRSALRNLQLVNTFGFGKQIDSSVTQQALSSIDDFVHFDFMDAVLSKDATKAIKIISSMFEKGIEFQKIFDSHLDYLRSLMIILTCSSTAGLIYLTEDEKKKYIDQIGKVDKDVAIYLITSMIGSLHDISRGAALNINPQTLFEKYAVTSMMEYSKLLKK